MYPNSRYALKYLSRDYFRPKSILLGHMDC